MIGGTVVQVVTKLDAVYIEVLDEGTLDRAWRKLDKPSLAHVGDVIWWQSYTGYLSRLGHFKDKNIGSCRPANAHGRP